MHLNVRGKDNKLFNIMVKKTQKIEAEGHFLYFYPYLLGQWKQK